MGEKITTVVKILFEILPASLLTIKASFSPTTTTENTEKSPSESVSVALRLSDIYSLFCRRVISWLTGTTPHGKSAISAGDSGIILWPFCTQLNVIKCRSVGRAALLQPRLQFLLLSCFLNFHIFTAICLNLTFWGFFVVLLQTLKRF